MGGIIKGITRDSNLTELIKEEELRKTQVAHSPKQAPMVDRSLIDNGYWDRATFTVPDDVPDSRVQKVSDQYRKKAAGVWEAQGFKIMEMLGPHISDVPCDPGRKRYDILLFVRRTPVEITVDVPDKAVPALQAKGLKLKE